MSASFRIQGRQCGEPWKTLHTCDAFGLADALFSGMSKEAHSIGRMQFPRWEYMRLVHYDGVVGRDLVLRERSMADWSKARIA